IYLSDESWLTVFRYEASSPSVKLPAWWRSRFRYQRHQLLRARAGDAHDLRLRRVAALDLNVARGNAELFRQKLYKRVVGRALDGRRGHSHAQRAVVLARRLGLRCARHDAHGEAYSAVFFLVSNHASSCARLRARGFVRDQRLNTNHRDRNRPLQEVEQEKYDDGRDVEHTDRRDDAAEGAEHRLRRPYEEVQRGAVRACHPRHDEAREDEERVKGEAAEQYVADERDRRAAYHALEQSLYDEEYSTE